MNKHRRTGRQTIRAWLGRLRRFIRRLQREGRSHMEVKSFISQQVGVTVNADRHRHKVFQILFGKDGSLYVSFPYFAHTNGLLKVASHLVKYSHPPDGEAHFSQHSKIRTLIRRQSVPLDEQQGHIFSILIQGLRAFEAVSASKEHKVSPKRTTLTFDVTDRFPKAIRIVGRWYWIEELDVDPRPATIGPLVQAVDSDGIAHNAFIIANPHDKRHVLLLTCIPQDSISPSRDLMMFIGGFDPASRISKSKKPTASRTTAHARRRVVGRVAIVRIVDVPAVVNLPPKRIELGPVNCPATGAVTASSSAAIRTRRGVPFSTEKVGQRPLSSFPFEGT